MKQAARILSIYAADTSGVCSALYELGGMIVIHDASGCNSTYTTHDEPRWYRSESMVFISALTEADAILGNDDRLIDEIVTAARDLAPRFVAVCGAPIPMMIGTDFSAIAAEVESKTGIPTFGIATNGTRSYLKGVAEAFRVLIERFCADPISQSDGLSANLLGATPLDFSTNGQILSIKRWLEENGFRTVASLAMDTSLDEIERAGSARVNLVLSSDGLDAAELLQKRFGTPYVVGVPVGEAFGRILAQRLTTAVETGESSFPCAERGAPEEGGVATVGESVWAGSLASAIIREENRVARVLCPLETDRRILAPGDLLLPDEEETERQFARADSVVADPLYAPICPESTPFVRLPHEAFSGRCFRREIPNLIGRQKIGFLDGVFREKGKIKSDFSLTNNKQAAEK